MRYSYESHRSAKFKHGLEEDLLEFGSNMGRRLSSGNWEIEIFKTPEEEEKTKKEQFRVTRGGKVC